MIRLKDVPITETGMADLVKKLEVAGYETDEAQRITDEASAIVISFFKQLDDKIEAVSKEEEDQAVIQALVMALMIKTSNHLMDIINAQTMMKMFGRFFRR